MKAEIDCRMCVHYDVCYLVINRGLRNPCKNGVECKHYLPIENADKYAEIVKSRKK